MSKRTKENPLTAAFLTENADQGASGVAALPNRLNRYAGAHQRALLMADYAESITELSMAEIAKLWPLAAIPPLPEKG